MPKQGPPADAEERDPTPFLRPSLEMQRADQNTPFDGKKSCWVPDDKEGFVPGEIKSTKGDQVTVSVEKQGVSGLCTVSSYSPLLLLKQQSGA